MLSASLNKTFPSFLSVTARVFRTRTPSVCLVWDCSTYFYLTMHSTHFIMVIWHRTYGKGPLGERENRCCHIGYSLRLAARKCFYLTTHSTHLVTVIWRRTVQIAREVTRCHHMGYSFLLTARVLLYAQSLRQDSTYHSLCYTSRGVLAGTRNTFKLKDVAPW